MKHEPFLYRHPVFTGEELAGYLATRGEVGARGKEAFLAYYTRVGRVVRIRRGLYAVIPPGAASETFPVDPFLVAAKLTPDSILSHHTALEFHGNAYSVWKHLIYAACRPIETFAFRSQVFRGTRFPTALLRSGKKSLGVLERERMGVGVLVTSMERTMVDILHRPDLSGGWEEIWRSLEAVEYFHVDKVVEYTLLLDNATTAAKVGFYLDQHREDLLVEDQHLTALRMRRSRQPHYLDRNHRHSGSLVANWNLVVPNDVLNKSWGDVL